MGKIIYPRNTSFPLTVNYLAQSGIHGVTAFFTAKVSQFDTDTLDSDAIIKKNISLTPGTGGNPDVGSTTLNPSDVPDSQNPGNYFYDVKVLDSSGAIYMIDSGSFILTANPTNREA